MLNLITTTTTAVLLPLLLLFTSLARAACVPDPYFTEYGPQTSTMTITRNYAASDTQPLTFDVTVTSTGCSPSTDSITSFNLRFYASTGGNAIVANCPLNANIPLTSDGSTTRLTVTCDVARGAIPANPGGTTGRYFFGYAYTTSTTTGSGRILNKQPIIFTHDAAQPTQGLVRRRQRRERAGLQVPYGVQCEWGETACHLGGANWQCINTMTSLESCGACPNEGGLDCVEELEAAMTTSLASISGTETIAIDSARIACMAGQCRLLAGGDDDDDDETAA